VAEVKDRARRRNAPASECVAGADDDEEKKREREKKEEEKTGRICLIINGTVLTR